MDVQRKRQKQKLTSGYTLVENDKDYLFIEKEEDPLIRVSPAPPSIVIRILSKLWRSS